MWDFESYGGWHCLLLEFLEMVVVVVKGMNSLVVPWMLIKCNFPVGWRESEAMRMIMRLFLLDSTVRKF